MLKFSFLSAYLAYLCLTLDPWTLLVLPVKKNRSSNHLRFEDGGVGARRV